MGNGDAHLKNFSIIYNDEGQIRLSPAYDIVSSKLVIPGEGDLALPMNGKKDRITGRDFEQFAGTLKIRSRASYKRIVGKIELIANLIREDAYLTGDEKERFLKIVEERTSRLNSLRL